uniref:Uncharacterized protein n=1 Tax=Anguilla anguilla TaxID=7936 RepID=A0A0E9UB84_ANGAN
MQSNQCPSPSLLTFPTRQYMDCMDLSHPFLSIDRSCILPITFTVNSVSPKAPRVVHTQ